MNTLALEKIVKDLDINEKISLVELILADIKLQSIKLFKKDEHPQKNINKNILDYGFCGVWENNSIMTDSTEYVRSIRRSEMGINLSFPKTDW